MQDKSNINELHIPVLMQESLDSLELSEGLTVVDCTVNRAGHALEIAKKIGKKGKLIIFDLDKQALEYSVGKLENLENHPKIIAVHSNYRHIKKVLADSKIKSVDRIFADLGLSSQELDISGRGFSFLRDEPLHMTFNSEVDEDTFTAKDLINNLNQTQLENIFKVYGGEEKAWKIAHKIVEVRESLKKERKVIETTKQLADIVESVSPRKGKTHPATKVFQAIRIAVNDEYEGIEELLSGGWEYLENGGIFSVITFHSGEDRIVKNFFKSKENKKQNNKQVLTKPGRVEVKNNKRSRSAILRTIKKI